VESGSVATTSGSSACGQRGGEKPLGQGIVGGMAGLWLGGSNSGPFPNSAGLTGLRPDPYPGLG
jgi:hypothetical protein